MLTAYQLRFIALISILLCATLMLFVKMPKRQSNVFIRSSRHKYYGIYHRLYNLSIKTPVIRRYVYSIKERLSLTTSGDVSDIIVTTMRTILFIMGIIVIIIAVSFLFIKTWYIWGVTFILLYFIVEMVADVFIGRIKLMLLEQLVTFIDYLRSAFLATEMIDEAYLIAMDRLDAYTYRYLRKQVENVYDVLIDSDGELALQRYYHVAPNAYFKLLSGLSYIVKEHGDSKHNESSSFIKSLSHLSAEVKEDILRRKRLSFGLRSMNIIAIMPILMMHPIKAWACDSFFPLKQFYNGPMGFVVEVIMFIIVMLSCIIIRQIQRESVVENTVIANVTTEKFIYSKFDKMIDFFIPDTSSVKYQKVLKRQQSAHSFVKMPLYYTRKVLFALVSLIAAIMLSVIINSIGVDDILNSPTTNEGYFVGELTGEELDNALALTAFDREVLAIEHWSKDKLDNFLSDTHQLAGEQKRATLDRILNKQIGLEKYKFTPKTLCIIYVIALIGWWLPDVFLIIKQKLLKVDVELEITRFQLVVTMLMNVETMTVDQMLEWMEIFSHLFKRPIQKAIMNYDAGAVEALTELKLASNHIAYQTLINHLINSVESLTIPESFSEFETEKQYYQEKRTLVNNQIVKKKIFLGQVVGFVPIYGLMVIYFMFPLVYASMNEMQLYFDKLQF